MWEVSRASLQDREGKKSIVIHKVRNFRNRIQHHVRALENRMHVPDEMGTAAESEAK